MGVFSGLLASVHHKNENEAVVFMCRYQIIAGLFGVSGPKIYVKVILIYSSKNSKVSLTLYVGLVSWTSSAQQVHQFGACLYLRRLPHNG